MKRGHGWAIFKKQIRAKFLQEYALFSEFTVRETLQYFGRIYGMSSDEVKAQTKFLIKLLDLPDNKSRLIRSFRLIVLLNGNKFLSYFTEALQNRTRG